ncbi:MAG: HAD hydrolase-like protein, partial [Burkholderiales bacterium]
ADLKIDCNCRKPKTGMIDQAMRDFNGDRKQSWLIGDTTVDMETARRAGLRSILVETGYAGLDGRTSAAPDFVLPDLSGAVTFILHRYPKLFADCTALAANINKGALIFIGGQPRCGKSLFASVLRDALNASAKRAFVMAMDRWAKKEPAAGAGPSGKFEMDAVQSLVNALADTNRRPDSLSLPNHHKRASQSNASEETLAVNPTDIILIEGVAALALDSAASTESHRYHVDIEESVRKQRVLAGHRLQGHSDEQSLHLYLAHLQEDFPAIENFAARAKRISLSSP